MTGLQLHLRGPAGPCSTSSRTSSSQRTTCLPPSCRSTCPRSWTWPTPTLPTPLSAFASRQRRIQLHALDDHRPAASAPTSSGSNSFVDRDYERISLVHRDPYGPMKILQQQHTATAHNYCGVLLFHRDQDKHLSLSLETEVLEIFVAGDTACNIYTQLHGHKSNRPTAHDLMSTMLERAAQTGRNQWQLLRVAIVDLRDEVFIGRLYFGDPATGVVAWDCDCRPSDGVFLSLRTGCPFFVSKEVWAKAAVALRHSKVHAIALAEAQMAQAHRDLLETQQRQQQQQHQQHQRQQQQQQQQQPVRPAFPPASAGMGPGNPEAQSSKGQGQASGMAQPVPFAPLGDFTALRPDDPDAIKLLKRELAVAVREEDYRAAARIRDHPYMVLYRRMAALRSEGMLREADDLSTELWSLIALNQQ